MMNFDLGNAVRRITAAVPPIGSGSGPVASTTVAVFGLAAAVGLHRLLNNHALGNPLFGDTSWADWSEEIVLITGGNSGIGRVMAHEFAQHQIKVVVFDIDGPDFPDFPENVVFYRVDLTDDHALRAVGERVRGEVGDPTVLINNAGVARAATLLDSSPEKIRRIFAVNAIAPLVVTSMFLPAMVRRNHGHIVTIASLGSFLTLANSIDYSCTKTGLVAFHEGLRQELRHRYRAPAVRTTIVHPYWVRTPLLGARSDHPFFRHIVLDPAVVSNAVVNQVLSGRSGTIVLPRHLSVASWLRAFPIWLQELIRNSQAHMLEELPKEA